MSLTTITISTVAYQSYASATEADAVLAVDPVRSTTWAAATDDEKGEYLVAATRRLDLLLWIGEPAATDQANEWPRTGITYRGEAVSGIPAPLERATALLAGTIASNSTAADKSTQSAASRAISEVTAGPATIRFSSSGGSTKSLPLADETAFELVKQWLGGGLINYAAFVSGLGGCPGDDDYGRYRGLA